MAADRLAAGREESGTAELARSLESLARDLLILTKTFSAYPEGHPAPLRVAERLAAWSPPGGRRDLALGFTPTRILLERSFFGAPGSRCEALAGYFHGRKLMRLTWTSRVGAADVNRLASLMATTRLDGDELRDALRAGGAGAIEIEPLEASKIHGALSLGDRAEGRPAEADERSLQAWLWLHGESAGAEDVARALGSAEFWAAGAENPSALAGLLLRHQDKLGAALGILPEAGRGAARAHLADVPRSLSPAELAAALLNEADRRTPAAEGLPLLLEGLSAEGLVDLLAEMVAAGGGLTPRVEVLFRCMSPRWDVDSLLSLVEARLSRGEAAGRASDACQTLRAFLLDLEEGPFFQDDYLGKLEAASRDSEADRGGRPGARLAEDAEAHVDWVCLRLAAGGPEGAADRLRKRLASRAPDLTAGQALALARAADDEVPAALAGQDAVAAEIFRRIIGGARALDEAGRDACVRFARDHEGAVLEPVLSSLVRERRIAGRKFLVDILSALSPDTTAPMMEKACSAPWYFLRNIVTVLGRRADRSSTPVLEALLAHPHEKVRREALKSLHAVGGAARRALEAFAEDPTKRSDERQLARRMLARKAHGP